MAPWGETSELKLSGLGAIRSKWGSIRMTVDEGMAKCSEVRAGLSVHANTHTHADTHLVDGRAQTDSGDRRSITSRGSQSAPDSNGRLGATIPMFG